MQEFELFGLQVPVHFYRWINIRDIYYNFYHEKAYSVVDMMEQLNIYSDVVFRNGLDETLCLSKVMARLIRDGAYVDITAEKDENGRVYFYYKNRL